MDRLLFLLLGLLFLASPVHAADSIAAGFAPGAVWLSTTLPTEGDTVEAYTVVYDASDVSIEGDVTFLIDGESIGSSPFTLSPGETEIRSVRWTAVAGTHVLSARIDSALYQETGEAAELETSTTASTTITVKELPPPPEPVVASTTASEPENTSSAIRDAVIQTPFIGTVLGSAVEITESIRASGIETLSAYASATSTVSSSTGSVLGTTTIPATDDSSLPKTVAKAVLPVFFYPGIFYPFFLIVLGVLFFWFARRLGNPGRRRRR